MYKCEICGLQFSSIQTADYHKNSKIHGIKPKQVIIKHFTVQTALYIDQKDILPCCCCSHDNSAKMQEQAHCRLDKVPSGARIPPTSATASFRKSTKYVALTLDMAVICFM